MTPKEVGEKDNLSGFKEGSYWEIVEPGEEIEEPPLPDNLRALPMSARHAEVSVGPKYTYPIDFTRPECDVLWKLVSNIINTRLIENIDFHDSLHGFRKARGTGTAILEANLASNIAMRDGKTQYSAFIDLSKAYGGISREKMLTILEGYGVGPNIRSILKTFWENQVVALKQNNFYGKAFKIGRGVTQGDIVSPMIFNIVVDTVVRVVTKDIKEKNPTTPNSELTTNLYYADDGLIARCNSEQVQDTMNVTTDLFKRVGLQMNEDKTKVMVGDIGKLGTRICKEAYDHRNNESGMSYEERMKEKMTCPRCEASFQQKNLQRHMLMKHDIDLRVRSDVILNDPPKVVRVNKSNPKCPRKDCTFNHSTTYNLRRHYASPTRYLNNLRYGV